MNPTKKQRELLIFIDDFIKNNGYGPSYREIMRGLGYKSVSTVATHVDELIARGFLQKRDKSARSLEVVGLSRVPSQKSPAERAIERKIKKLESLATDESAKIEILRKAMEILNEA